MNKMKELTSTGWWYGTTDNKNVAYYTKAPPKMHATITDRGEGMIAKGQIYGIKESGCHGVIHTMAGDFDTVVKEVERWCKSYLRIESLIEEREDTQCH